MAAEKDPTKGLIAHLSRFGGGVVDLQEWHPPHNVDWARLGVSIATIRPSEERPHWLFATVGCWQAVKGAHRRTEFALSGIDCADDHVELLKMAAFLHLNPKYDVHLGKVLAIGRPWVIGSKCTHLLASLPYPYGPDFEVPNVDPSTRYVWLLPVTEAEAQLAEAEGVEALEQRFEEAEISFADPYRAAVIS